MSVTLSADQLNDTDDKLVRELREGRVTPQYLADRLGVSRPYASERLKRLVEHGHVSRPAPGLYELADDPLGEDPSDAADGNQDVAELQERIGELESDLTDAREDVEDYKEKLQSCRDELESVPDRQELKRAIDDLEIALENGGKDIDVAVRRLKEAAGVDR